MSPLIVPANCTLVAAPAPLLSGAAAPPSLDAAPREFMASENIMERWEEMLWSSQQGSFKTSKDIERTNTKGGAKQTHHQHVRKRQRAHYHEHTRILYPAHI